MVRGDKRSEGGKESRFRMGAGDEGDKIGDLMMGRKGRFELGTGDDGEGAV
jgi:hypothetical protein